MGIFVFLKERDWSWKICYGNNTKGVILFLLWCTFVVSSFKNTASIFPEIFFIQYFTIFQSQILWRHHWSILHNTKTSISLKRKKIFRKEKRHFSVFRKAFQISRKYFSCHIHFKKGKDKCTWQVFRQKLYPLKHLPVNRSTSFFLGKVTNVYAVFLCCCTII